MIQACFLLSVIDYGMLKVMEFLMLPTIIHIIEQGVKLIFTRGHISLTVAFKRPNVILGLYKCNYSLIVK